MVKTIKVEIPIGEMDEEFNEPILYSPRMLAQGKLVKMQKYSNGKFVLDKCPETNGVWLDAGEIKKARRQNLLKVLWDWVRGA